MEHLEKSTNEWFRLGDVFYRRYKLCQMEEQKHNISYSFCHFAVAKNGGLMAFVKKTNQFIMDVTNPIKEYIRIFYQNFKPIGGQIKFEEKKIICFDFSKDENLYCIMHDGRIYKFDIFSFNFKYKLGSLVFDEDNIVSARLYENGFTCITQSGDFYLIKNIRDPDAILFAELKEVFDGEIPNDYLFIPAEVSRSGALELLVTHPKHGVVIYYQNGSVKYMKHSYQVDLSKTSGKDNYGSDDLGKINNIFISPKNVYVAMYSDSGNIFVFNADLDPKERKMSSTKLTFERPYQIMWCAEDCIALCHNNSIFLIGPENAMYKINFNIKTSSSSGATPNLYMIPEIDGIRIITDSKCEFLQKVSDELYNAIFPLSMEPAKRLIDAYKFAEEKKPNCDEEIRAIRNYLPEAVNVLLSSTTSLWDLDDQKFLMKAAQHGKTFLNHTEFNFNYFVQICRDLRILNNLRNSETPRLITYEQYQTLEPKQLILRLIKTQNFYLAHEISLFLNLKTRKVYQKWAIAKIKNLPKVMSPDEEKDYYEEIQKKLKEISGVSYIKLAKKAFKYQKEQIGIKFLENEKSILTKIPQYVELKMWDTALELAIQTYDSNVIYTVVDKILTNETIDTFKDIVSKNKRADPIVINYLKTNHQELLEEYLESKGNFEFLFFHSLENYYKCSSLGLRRDYIKKCRNYLKALSINDTKKEWDFYKNVIEEIDKATLLKKDLISEGVVRNTDITSFDSSVYDMYKFLIKNEKSGLAESKNKSLFNVSQKFFNIIRIRAYAELNQLDAIKLIGNNIKQSQLTYIALAETCHDYRFDDAAVDFCKKATDEDSFEYRIKLLRSIGRESDALEMIIANKKFDRRREFVDEIIQHTPELKFRVEEFCVKYRTNLDD